MDISIPYNSIPHLDTLLGGLNSTETDVKRLKGSNKISTKRINKVKEKVLDIDSLPSYKETMELLNYLSSPSWFIFTERNNIYNFYNTEFIDRLAKNIKKLKEKPIIEICAGNGKLSHQLRRRGIDIIATDDFSWDEIKRDDNLVERLTHTQALIKYKPRMVIASWIPYKSRIGFDVLDFPSIRYFIDIGEGIGGATWLTEEVLKRKEFVWTDLDDVNKYSLCRTDFLSFKPEKSTVMRHSYVTLFSRLDQPNTIKGHQPH